MCVTFIYSVRICREKRMKHLHVFRNNSISSILSRKYCNCRARVLEHVRVVCCLVRGRSLRCEECRSISPTPSLIPRRSSDNDRRISSSIFTVMQVQWRLSTPLLRSSSFNLHFMRIISESIIHVRLLCYSRYYFSDIITLWSIAVNAMNSFEKNTTTGREPRQVSLSAFSSFLLFP